jgi:hypothetical protein
MPRLTAAFFFRTSVRTTKHCCNFMQKDKTYSIYFENSHKVLCSLYTSLVSFEQAPPDSLALTHAHRETAELVNSGNSTTKGTTFFYCHYLSLRLSICSADVVSFPSLRNLFNWAFWWASLLSHGPFPASASEKS